GLSVSEEVLRQVRSIRESCVQSGILGGDFLLLHARQFRRVVHQRENVIARGHVIVAQRHAAAAGAGLLKRRTDSKRRAASSKQGQQEACGEISPSHHGSLLAARCSLSHHLATTTVPVCVSFPAEIL